MVTGQTCRTNRYLSRSGGNSLLSRKGLLCLKEFFREFNNSVCCVCVEGGWANSLVFGRLQCQLLSSTSHVTPYRDQQRWAAPPGLPLASSPHFSMTFVGPVSIAVWLSKSPEPQTDFCRFSPTAWNLMGPKWNCGYKSPFKPWSAGGKGFFGVYRWLQSKWVSSLRLGSEPLTLQASLTFDDLHVSYSIIACLHPAGVPEPSFLAGFVE